MNPAVCWRNFCLLDARFLELFAAYHFLSAKDWILQSGFKYAVDYVGYRTDPAISHAEFAVIVQASADDAAFLLRSSDNTLAVQELQGMLRLSNSVAKTFLLCHVMGVSSTLPPNPVTFLSSARVLLFAVKQWRPEEARNESDATSERRPLDFKLTLPPPSILRSLASSSKLASLMLCVAPGTRPPLPVWTKMIGRKLFPCQSSLVREYGQEQQSGGAKHNLN